MASRDGYVILTEKNPAKSDVRWANYLFNHLQKRAQDAGTILFNEAETGLYPITVKLDPALNCDFQVEREKSSLKLIARDNEKMLWLLYQAMRKIGDEDSRVDMSDLPPAIIQLNDTCGVFSFEYRGIYTPSNQDSDYSGLISADNAERGWGIWGHNLDKVVGEDAPESVYATVDGVKNRKQYCFSSEDTYKYIEQYITDQFGEDEKEGLRFVIAPNDNDIVCTCPSCSSIGNTKESAAPAVTSLIVRLSKRFPNRSFFTLSYLTTKDVPSYRLPQNAGVIISAMDLPYRFNVTDGGQSDQFSAQLKRWKAVAGKVYIWDYINNFDDYLTPFPVLKIAQQRIRFFREHGVTGVFFNGSGYDYAAFENMHTFALAALLIDETIPVEKLVHDYFNYYYPVSKTALYNFYIQLENRAVKCNTPFSLYGGIRDAKTNFLDESDFITFYNGLEDLVNRTKGEERKRLNRLFTGLTLTRLEIARDNVTGTYGYADKNGHALQINKDAVKWLTQLEEHAAFKNMERYREVGGEIDGYIAGWHKYILNPRFSVNLLLNKPLDSAAEEDEKYSGLSVLVDGANGLPDNYHCGWFISTDDKLEINLPVDEEIKKAQTLQMNFLNDTKHRILAPQSLEIIKNGKLYKTITTTLLEKLENTQVYSAEGKVDFSDAQSVTVRLMCPKGDKIQIAVDEIRLIP